MNRRLSLAGFALLLLQACKARPKTVSLDVVIFSYLSRPIFDVYLNSRDIGVAGPWPYSGRGAMSGVEIPIGGQKVSWRLDGPEGMVGNGETVSAKNLPELNNVQPNEAYLAVHIYPDETVELIASEHFPDVSQRGAELNARWRQSDGQ